MICLVMFKEIVVFEKGDFLLGKMVENEEMKSVKNILFQILFKSANRSFNELVKINLEPVSYLVPGGEDVHLYGYGFRKILRS